MHISKIIHFNREDREADLCISDGDYSVICYAYPIESISVNQDVNGLYGFLCTEIARSYEYDYFIEKLPQYYAYWLNAKVVSKNDCTVQIGKITICLDSEIPKDIHDGDYVSFRVQRLDLSQP